MEIEKTSIISVQYWMKVTEKAFCDLTTLLYFGFWKQTGRQLPFYELFIFYSPPPPPRVAWGLPPPQLDTFQSVFFSWVRPHLERWWCIRGVASCWVHRGKKEYTTGKRKHFDRHFLFTQVLNHKPISAPSILKLSWWWCIRKRRKRFRSFTFHSLWFGVGELLLYTANWVSEVSKKNKKEACYHPRW